MHRSQSHDREHRHDRFGNHRHVDRDAVAFLHAEFGQRVRRLGDEFLQVRVGDRARLTFRVGDPVVGNLGTLARGDVTVDAVNTGVQLAVAEPLGEREIPLEGLGRFLVPHQPVGLLAPEGERVGIGFGVDRWLRVRLLRELCAWRKATSLLEPRFKFCFGHVFPHALTSRRRLSLRRTSFLRYFPRGDIVVTGRSLRT